jgi:coatomer subunit beta'
LASLYNGNVFIYNYQTQAVVKQFEITELPVRIAKFIPRKQWIIVGSDDMLVRIFNYNTMECVHKWEAHQDYIRSIAVHPSLPYLLTSADDMSIKMWDWDQNWNLIRTFEGHTHYVMMVTFNPKDPNTFATASLDGKIKVWGITSSTAYFTLDGHTKGVNYVDYYLGADKPYLVSGADDMTVKVWDYQTKNCVATLEGHTNNVSVVCFHPEVPLVISGSEDGSVRLWNSKTYRLEKSLNYGWERAWALAYRRGSNILAVGFDEGLMLLKLGREVPAASMDATGKVIYSRHNEVNTSNVNPALEGTAVTDGDALQMPTKELGRVEVHPQILRHSPNGRFVVVCGEGEYTIYTALKWRNQAFGSAIDFAWAAQKAQYVTREPGSKIKVFDEFKEIKAFKPDFHAEGIFGGSLIGIRSDSFICFYDWQQLRLIRKIDVTPKNIYWAETGEQLVIATDSSFYVLKYNKALVNSILESGGDIPDDGIEDAFDVLHEFNEKVRTACWIGDCFIYTNSQNRLQYCVGSKTETISHLDRKLYILGYMPKYSRVLLIDKAMNLASYTLNLSVIEYETAVMRGDMTLAEKIFPRIPPQDKTRIAHFLEAQGYKELAFEVSTDSDHKFELAIQLGRLELAHEIAQESDNPQKWKQLSDLAINAFNVDLAEKCLWRAEDWSGLLLLYSSVGGADGYKKLAAKAKTLGQYNVAFMALFLLGELDDCIDTLVKAGRAPEAALFARSYVPSRVSELVKLWREDVRARGNPRQADSLADPAEYENLFPDIKFAVQAQEHFRRDRFADHSATEYSKFANDLDRDLIQEIQSLASNGGLISSPSPVASPVTSPVVEKSTVVEESPDASPVIEKATPPTPAPTPIVETVEDEANQLAQELSVDAEDPQLEDA